MSAHFIPAASNALMLKHLSAQGFDSVYLDSRLLSTQLLGTSDTDLLNTSAYFSYVQSLSAVTKMNVIADTYVSDQTDSLSDQVNNLRQAGCQAVVINDADFATTTLLTEALNTVKKAANTDDFEVIVKLDGFIKYGLEGLSTRIGIAEENGIDHIIISSITNDDLVIIKVLQSKAVISLIIDNANISYYSALQLNPKLILDTYHVYQGLIRSASSISQGMILRIFMG